MKIFSLIILLFFFSCRSHHDPKLPIDPWHGTYLHSSGKFTLALNHFDKEAVSVDIIEQGNKDLQGSFFADIKDGAAIFKDRTDPDCKIILQIKDDRINLTDLCHGTGDIDGLYMRTGDYK
jgi:hypothetical protein